MAETFHEKACKAAAMYLERKGYEILEQDGDGIVADDRGTLVIAVVNASKDPEGGFPEMCVESARKECERRMIEFVMDSDYKEAPVRLDIVTVLAVNDDRAIIRHHINVQEVLS